MHFYSIAHQSQCKQQPPAGHPVKSKLKTLTKYVKTLAKSVKTLTKYVKTLTKYVKAFRKYVKTYTKYVQVGKLNQKSCFLYDFLYVIIKKPYKNQGKVAFEWGQ